MAYDVACELYVDVFDLVLGVEREGHFVTRYPVCAVNSHDINTLSAQSIRDVSVLAG